MKSNVFLRIVLLALACFAAATAAANAQPPQSKSAEILSNADVILMTKSGLDKSIISRKINESKTDFDVSVKALVELQNAGVDREIIEAMLNRTDGAATRQETSTVETRTEPKSDGGAVSTTTTTTVEKKPLANAGDPKEILRSAKTVAIEKSSVHPSRQALEKELLKRKEWQALNLNLVRHKDGADLYIEIGYVSLSWVTHRYVFRVYDNKTGTVLAAGETTSWGSLAGNLAKEISKKLGKI